MMTMAAVLLFAMALPATAFPIVYAFAPWYKSIAGRGLMIMSVSIALLVDVSIVFTLLSVGAGTFPQVVQLLVFALLNVGMWFMLVVLIRTQVHTHHSRKGN